MADFKYKMDWVPEAKKLREQESQSGKESVGIGSKPKDEQPAMDQDFYESMYGAIMQYFDKAEDADKVLSSKKPDRDRIREMTLGEFDELTLRSSEEAALQRMESRTTQSLVEGGSEAFRTKLPEGVSLRPKLRDDTAKDEQEPTPVTVEPSGNGLMSPRLDTKGETPQSELQKYTNEYADVYLKEHEGMAAHSSLEGGKDTAAFGVKFSLGLKREDYSSDAEFAAAVSLKHRDKAKAKFGEEKWNALPDSVKYAMTDLNYNVGTIGSSGNKDNTVDAMKNTLEFVGMTTKAGEKASLVSLAKRRAWNWNKAADDIGESKITKIKQIPTTNGGTKFEYLDAEDNVVHSFTTSRKPVKLDSTGKATTLTQTRETTL